MTTGQIVFGVICSWLEESGVDWKPELAWGLNNDPGEENGDEWGVLGDT